MLLFSTGLLSIIFIKHIEPLKELLSSKSLKDNKQ